MRWLRLIGCVIVCELAGIVGGLLTRSAIADWYQHLNKPPLNPPAAVFGPVWTTLYLLMSIAVFLIWELGTGRRDVRRAMGFFIAQLVLNALWSPAFFGARSTLLGLVVIVPMLVLIVITTMAFFRLRTATGVLMLPYLAWVSFATYLNAGLYWLNR